MRGSAYCRTHDRDWPRRRAALIAAGERAPTPHDRVLLFRSQQKARWVHDPWSPGCTIWLAPALEEAFAVACGRAGLPVHMLSPACSNNGRGVWRRCLLDRKDDAAWTRGVVALRRRQARDGPPPAGWQYYSPSADPPADFRIKQVLRAAGPYSATRINGAADRTSKCKATRDTALAAAPTSADADAAFQRHLPELLRSLAHSPQACARLDTYRGAVGAALLARERGDYDPWTKLLSETIKS